MYVNCRGILLLLEGQSTFRPYTIIVVRHSSSSSFQIYETLWMSRENEDLMDLPYGCVTLWLSTLWLSTLWLSDLMPVFLMAVC